MSLSNNGTNGNYLQNSVAITSGAFSVACWTSLAVVTAFAGVWFIDDNATTFTGIDFENTGGSAHLMAYSFLTSSDLLAATLNKPYFVALTSGGTGTNCIAYSGTGGALTKVTVTASAAACAGPMTIFNEKANDEPLSGTIGPVKVWKGTQLNDRAIANEYRSMQPMRTGSIYSFLPMLNASQAGTDWSGQGNTYTKTGTLPSSTISAPTPYSQKMAMMMGG